MQAEAEFIDASLIPTRSDFVASQMRGETDVQIATARRFPRSVKAFKERALSLATLDEETAASCWYTLPARKGSTKPIEGPSIRLAEIAAGAYGNIRSQANVVDIGDTLLTVRAMCWDLESNNAVAVEVQRRITGKYGRFNDDMIVVTANAACSIALRNAIFKVVPFALVKPIYDAARKVAIGDAQTLSTRRANAIEHFSKMGVRSEQVCLKLGRAGVEDITLDDLAVLIGLSNAIKDGDTTVDDAFAPEAKEPTKENGANSAATKTEELAGKFKKPAEPRGESSNWAAKIAACKSSADLADLNAAMHADPSMTPDKCEVLEPLFIDRAKELTA